MKAGSFEITVDRIDVTMNGLFGGVPDVNKVYVPGLRHYWIDGREVKREEFEAAFLKVYPEARKAFNG